MVRPMGHGAESPGAVRMQYVSRRMIDMISCSHRVISIPSVKER